MYESVGSQELIGACCPPTDPPLSLPSPVYQMGKRLSDFLPSVSRCCATDSVGTDNDYSDETTPPSDRPLQQRQLCRGFRQIYETAVRYPAHIPSRPHFPLQCNNMASTDIVVSAYHPQECAD